MKVKLVKKGPCFDGLSYRFETDGPVPLKDGWKYVVSLMKKLSEVGKVSNITCTSAFENEMDFSDIGYYSPKSIREVEELVGNFIKDETCKCSFKVSVNGNPVSVGVGIFDPCAMVCVSEDENGGKAAKIIAKIVSEME